MKELTLEEIKRVELDILWFVSDYCNRNNLTYFLSDGTLLGAVRHNGFIPWDDDVDICMPRPDFDMFISSFDRNQKDGVYELIAPGQTKSRYYFAKIIDTRTVKIESGIEYKNDYLGVDIDIFPIDGSPTDFDEYDMRRKRINKLYKHYSVVACGYTGSLKHKCKVLLYRVLWGSKKSIINKATSLCKMNDYGSSKYAARYGQFSFGFRVDRQCYEKSILKLFEGKECPIPQGYDEVLSAQFGDYMTLPPEEERCTHHSNKMYWKD